MQRISWYGDRYTETTQEITGEGLLYQLESDKSQIKWQFINFVQRIFKSRSSSYYVLIFFNSSATVTAAINILSATKLHIQYCMERAREVYSARIYYVVVLSVGFALGSRPDAPTSHTKNITPPKNSLINIFFNYISDCRIVKLKKKMLVVVDI